MAPWEIALLFGFLALFGCQAIALYKVVRLGRELDRLGGKG